MRITLVNLVTPVAPAKHNFVKFIFPNFPVALVKAYICSLKLRKCMLLRVIPAILKKWIQKLKLYIERRRKNAKN